MKGSINNVRSHLVHILLNQTKEQIISEALQHLEHKFWSLLN